MTDTQVSEPVAPVHNTATVLPRYKVGDTVDVIKGKLRGSAKVLGIDPSAENYAVQNEAGAVGLVWFGNVRQPEEPSVKLLDLTQALKFEGYSAADTRLLAALERVLPGAAEKFNE